MDCKVFVMIEATQYFYSTVLQNYWTNLNVCYCKTIRILLKSVYNPNKWWVY